MTQDANQKDVSLRALLTEFIDETSPIRAALVYRLSDAGPKEMTLVEESWPAIPVERRRLLLTRLAEASESNFEVDFTSVALFALQDEDADVRQQAIATLWFSEEPPLMRRFIEMLEVDESSDVRAAAAEALGRFVLAGELGDIPAQIGREAEEALLNAINSSDEPLIVQRRALESLSYSGRDEVEELIWAAHAHEDILMRASAVFAMGRSADERWSSQVLRALDATEPALRYEAARAAGELALASAVVKLFHLAHSEDREVQEAAIWSLGEIGGTEAQNALFRLAESVRDDDLLEAIEDAVNMAQLGGSQFSAIILAGDEHDEFFDEDYELDDQEDDSDDVD